MRLIAKKRLKSKFRRYDLEIADTNNFVAEGVVVHNSNARYVWMDGCLHAGTRNHWLKPDEKSLWWIVANKYNIAEQLERFPGLQFCGEIFGFVNKLRYGHDQVNRYSFRVFDIYDISHGRYVDWDTLRDIIVCTTFELAPVIYEGPWINYEHHYELAQNKSTLYDGTSEGFVVRPRVERYDIRLGRVILKLHGEAYLALK